MLVLVHRCSVEVGELVERCSRVVHHELKQVAGGWPRGDVVAEYSQVALVCRSIERRKRRDKWRRGEVRGEGEEWARAEGGGARGLRAVYAARDAQRALSRVLNTILGARQFLNSAPIYCRGEFGDGSHFPQLLAEPDEKVCLL